MNNRVAPSRDLLASYPAFAYLRIRVLPARNSLLWWNFGITALMGAVLFCCSARDGTLWMQGKATGFFEHPAIFLFLFAQVYVPLVAVSAIRNLTDTREFERSALSPRFIEEKVRFALNRFGESVLRNNKPSRHLYGGLLLIGAAAFAWNSYQNQLPYRFVGFDFWDSSQHPWGYWSTRLYKFYIWLFVFPAIVHFLLLAAWSVRSIIIAATKDEHELKLDPYHEDGCGGVKVLVDSLLNPLIPVVLVAAGLAFAALFVHEKFDVTTVGGFILAIAFFCLIYVNPAIALRQTICREKRRQINEIKKKQREYYNRLYDPSAPMSDTEPAQALPGLSEICKHISSISEWPQLQRAAKFMGIAGSPIVAWGLKQLGAIAKQYLT